jgi:hypothetical protein
MPAVRGREVKRVHQGTRRQKHYRMYRNEKTKIATSNRSS